MKLPDFLHNDIMNELRMQMGAPLCNNFRIKHDYRPIELSIEEQLINGGIEVNLDQIIRLPDGTIGVSNGANRLLRALLHIRDVANYGGRNTLPKFHIFHCSVLERMQRDSRFGRYVLAHSDDGKFLVNLIGSSKNNLDPVALDVCQQCLTALNWKGFTSLFSREERIRAVKFFSLKEFFAKYPKDLVSVKPTHNTDTAPLNDYPHDWEQVKTRVRAEKGLQCEACKRILGEAGKKFLHLHHKNGLKYDNSSANLKLLCIACHAEEPLHDHMKALPEYSDFLSKSWPTGW